MNISQYIIDFIPVILLFLLGLVIVIVAPFITIWSLNTLFPTLAIPTNFWTWLATFWIQAFVIVSYTKNK